MRTGEEANLLASKPAAQLCAEGIHTLPKPKKSEGGQLWNTVVLGSEPSDLLSLYTGV